MYAMGTLALVVSTIPLLFIGWRVLSIPFRRWIPVLFFLMVIILLHGASALLGENGMAAIIYLLAGAGKQG